MADKKSDQDPKGESLFPLLPLREVIIFPHMVVPLFVGREKSIAALEQASKKNNDLFLVTQKDASVLNPDREDLYDVGTVVSIIQMLRLPDNTVKVLIEGKYRAKIDEFSSTTKGHEAKIERCNDILGDETDIEAAVRSVKTIFEQYVKLNKRIPPELLMSISSITDPSRLGDIIVAHLTMKISEKQEILNAIDVEKRLKLLLEKMQAEIEIINVERRIRSRVKIQMERSQKEYYLNEQMNAIQKELGHKEDGKSDIVEMEEKLAEKKMSDEGREKVRREIRKLKSMSPMSAEAAVIRNYIDWMLHLPWGEYTKDDNDVAKARKILELDHYGLEDVKERILEYLAVKSLIKGKGRGTILCFEGPPGVGKTSVARSLAESLGRKFVRISLGGLRDEAEIRGHRRTYIGALPGKIIQSLKKVGIGNPVILLDEIDKMGHDFRGDPASAMLEVLDPEQNKTFSDLYLEVDYDLSAVIFIMTANDLSAVPTALRDRMEVINVSGYTNIEKVQIAKKYLLPKAQINNGLTDYKVHMSEKTLTSIIRSYTKEAGVREIERMLNTVCRKIATEVVSKKLKKGRKFYVSNKNISKYLGPVRFDRGDLEQGEKVGLANGLAWTAVGGEVLHIEVLTTTGTGKLLVTGKIGEVMQESVKTALSYVRSISDRLRIDQDWYQENDIHVHIPEGAVPKDGPSAGITLATALTSAIGDIPVKQCVGMTGEITLRGRILPIGGLKEKMLAAKQAGITTLVIPERNFKDLAKIPHDIQDGLSIHCCDEAEEVLKLALGPKSPEEFLGGVPLKVVEDKDNASVAN